MLAQVLLEVRHDVRRDRDDTTARSALRLPHHVHALDRGYTAHSGAGAAVAVGLVGAMSSPAWAAFPFDRYDGTGTLDVVDVQGFYGWPKAQAKVDAADVAIEAVLGRDAVRTCDGAPQSTTQLNYVAVNRTLQKVKGKQVYVFAGFPDGVWFPAVPPSRRARRARPRRRS